MSKNVEIRSDNCRDWRRPHRPYRGGLNPYEGRETNARPATRPWLRIPVLAWFRRATFPNCAPVRSTLTLTLELFCQTAHASSARGAHPVKNAGKDVFTGLRLGVRHLQFSWLDFLVTRQTRSAHRAQHNRQTPQQPGLNRTLRATYPRSIVGIASPGEPVGERSACQALPHHSSKLGACPCELRF
jgi:hypothetical protein